MSAPRFPVAVHVLLLRGDEVLLVRRCNTGFEDGKLSVVAGHVEPGEAVTQAAVREAGEEVGLSLSRDRLRVVGVIHRKASEGRVDFFLAYPLDDADAEPQNREPEKCSELVWAALAHLPADTIPYVRAGIEMFRAGSWFQEFGGEAKLIFLCGKMAAGKTTLARQLAEREGAVLLVQDELLDSLYPDEITDMPGFVRRSTRLRNALEPHVCALLAKGISVVLDFPGNTRAQRAWFRRMFERANVDHELHFVDASDALCKSQLADRSRHLPPGTPWTTEGEFEAVTAYFDPPAVDEGFNVIRHARA